VSLGASLARKSALSFRSLATWKILWWLKLLLLVIDDRGWCCWLPLLAIEQSVNIPAYCIWTLKAICYHDSHQKTENLSLKQWINWRIKCSRGNLTCNCGFCFDVCWAEKSSELVCSCWDKFESLTWQHSRLLLSIFSSGDSSRLMRTLLNYHVHSFQKNKVPRDLMIFVLHSLPLCFGYMNDILNVVYKLKHELLSFTIA
jgi:hypothetical protein